MKKFLLAGFGIQKERNGEEGGEQGQQRIVIPGPGYVIPDVAVGSYQNQYCKNAKPVALQVIAEQQQQCGGSE